MKSLFSILTGFASASMLGLSFLAICINDMGSATIGLSVGLPVGLLSLVLSDF